MSKIKELLDFTEEDLIDKNMISIRLCKKIDKNQEYAKTILWLAIEFLNKKKSSVEVKELKKFISKSKESAKHLLDMLESYYLLKSHKSEEMFAPTRYILNDKDLLIDLIPYCKNHLDLDKKGKKK